MVAIVAAIRLRGVLQSDWWLATGGVLSVLVGGLLLFFPAAGALSVVWVIGAYALASGILLLALAARLRRLARERAATPA